MKRGEVYYFILKQHEHIQGGRRPCVIVQNDVGNKYSPNLIVVPITTAKKQQMITHVNIPSNNRVSGIILCEAITTIPKSSVSGEKIDDLDFVTMSMVNKALRASIGLNEEELIEC